MFHHVTEDVCFANRTNKCWWRNWWYLVFKSNHVCILYLKVMASEAGYTFVKWVYFYCILLHFLKRIMCRSRLLKPISFRKFYQLFLSLNINQELKKRRNKWNSHNETMTFGNTKIIKKFICSKIRKKFMIVAWDFKHLNLSIICNK